MEDYNYYLGYIEKSRSRSEEKSMGAVLAFVGVVFLYVGLKMLFGI